MSSPPDFYWGKRKTNKQTNKYKKERKLQTTVAHVYRQLLWFSFFFFFFFFFSHVQLYFQMILLCFRIKIGFQSPKFRPRTLRNSYFCSCNWFIFCMYKNLVEIWPEVHLTFVQYSCNIRKCVVSTNSAWF